ncbi:MAG TPA: XdhC family protein [Thermoanaerobaculia bacterium]|nr:XdhC family protein [Thermoanaerobaculia bacterium]
MIHWQESAEVFERLAEVAARGGSAALATVVRVSGSAYRRPGAKLLVTGGGASLGGVSGGCLEADVREVAAKVLAGAEPRLLHYDTSGGDDDVLGLGLGCRGRVEVFVQPATDGPLADLASAWRRRLAADAPFAAVTALTGSDEAGTAAGATALFAADGRDGSLGAALDSAVAARLDGWLEGGAASSHEFDGGLLFVEVLSPPPHLVVCGAGDDAVPLVALAAEAGFRVRVADHRPALVTAERFPAAAAFAAVRPESDDLELPPAERSLAVVMTHSLAHDRAWTRRLLAAGFPYVGQLGPRERTREIRDEIGAEGDGRLHGPVGLDLGADGPRQVAISIVAELLAVVSGRRPRHLSERLEAIHA